MTAAPLEPLPGAALMHQQVLSRAVTCDDGREYPEGTPVSDLPEPNRESVIGTGWTRPAPVERSATEPSDGASDPDASAVSTAATDSADTDTAAEPPAGDTPADTSGATADVATDPTGERDDSPALATLDLSPDLIELLAGAGITTVAEAIAHRAAHGSFRTIKKIGKASDALITAEIDS